MIDWSTQPLGKMKDSDLARRLGVSRQAVSQMRKTLGIGLYDPAAAVDWDAQPLGRVPDHEIAARVGLCRTVVARERRRRGIEGKRCPAHKGIDWDAQPLGQEPDTQIARRLGVLASCVMKARACRGIAPFQGPSKPDTIWDNEPLLGRAPVRELASKYGVSTTAVRYAERRRGLRRTTTPSSRELREP